MDLRLAVAEGPGAVEAPGLFHTLVHGIRDLLAEAGERRAQLLSQTVEVHASGGGDALADRVAVHLAPGIDASRDVVAGHAASGADIACHVVTGDPAAGGHAAADRVAVDAPAGVHAASHGVAVDAALCVHAALDVAAAHVAPGVHAALHVAAADVEIAPDAERRALVLKLDLSAGIEICVRLLPCDQLVPREEHHVQHVLIVRPGQFHASGRRALLLLFFRRGGRRGRGLTAAEELVDADLKDVGQQRQHGDVRARHARLPLAHRLIGDAQAVGQLLLGQIVLLAETHDVASQNLVHDPYLLSMFGGACLSERSVAENRPFCQ